MEALLRKLGTFLRVERKWQYVVFAAFMSLFSLVLAGLALVELVMLLCQTL